MNVRITPSLLSGSVNAISSKSDAHRALICAALADAPTEIEIHGESIDIKTTIECLCAMGATIEKISDTVWRVSPLWNFLSDSPIINCRESGSTLRFLLPIAAALGLNATFIGEGRLPQRPIDVLTQQLSSHGCRVSCNALPVSVSGTLSAGEFNLPGDISSQFITGLLFALAVLKKDSKIMLSSSLESKAYVDMTIGTLKQFGVEIIEMGNGYFVPGGQMFRSPQKIRLQGDWSNAAFWLSAGAISGTITCKGLDLNSAQGDKAIIQILKEFGADVTINSDSIKVSGGNLKACTIDAAEIPDLVPILSVVAATARGITRINNAKRLRLKESDRLSAMADCLNRLGVAVVETEDSLAIEGCSSFKGGVVNGFADHRIVMSMAIASTRCETNLIIEGAQAIEKSYPNFFKDFKMLGGAANVI